MRSKRKYLTRALLDGVVMRDVAGVRALLQQGADANAVDVEHSETPLILAVKFAGEEIVRLLVESGAKIDARDDWGRSAIFYAAVSSKVFGILLEAGADVHARDGEGQTILMRKVSESASLSDVEELIRLGVDPCAQDKEGETALDFAEELGLVSVIARLRSLME